MRTPTEYEIEELFHAVYDPVKSHDYYEKHKHLTGRQKAAPKQVESRSAARQKNTGHRARQKQELASAIRDMQTKLHKLEALIKQKEHAEASENRKGKAKKERAAKEKNKPATAAEKAKTNRESKQYRDKHQQKLKTKAKGGSKSGGGSSKGKADAASPKKQSVTELKSLATRVRGQIAVAKQKLAAL